MDDDHWTLDVAPDWASSFGDVTQVLAFLRSPGDLIQEHDRGWVYRGQAAGRAIVVKRSKTQERRAWPILTSVYRGGEGSRTFRNLTRLERAGVAVPAPIFALERRRAGFVVESWHACEYLDGMACTCADAPRVAVALRALHDRGWVHRDPHVKNFLRAGDTIRVIDWSKAQPWRSTYARRYDLVLLNKCCPGAAAFYPEFDEADVPYRLARRHNAWIVGWRRVKRLVRARLGIRRGTPSPPNEAHQE